MVVYGIDVYSNSHSFWTKILDLSSFLLKFLPDTTLIVFCLLSRLIEFHLEDIDSTVIHGQILNCKNLTDGIMNSSLASQLNSLKELKKRHLVIVKLVEKLNKYFGFYLLVAVTYCFIALTNISMFLLLNVMKGDGLSVFMTGVVILDCLTQLYLITSSCDGISTQV